MNWWVAWRIGRVCWAQTSPTHSWIAELSEQSYNQRKWWKTGWSHSVRAWLTVRTYLRSIKMVQTSSICSISCCFWPLCCITCFAEMSTFMWYSIGNQVKAGPLNFIFNRITYLTGSDAVRKQPVFRTSLVASNLRGVQLISLGLSVNLQEYKEMTNATTEDIEQKFKTESNFLAIYISTDCNAHSSYRWRLCGGLRYK